MRKKQQGGGALSMLKTK